MLTYTEKLREIHKCKWGYIADASVLGLNILKGKKEDDFSREQKYFIDQFYYRYRKQIYPDDKKLWKLEREEFYEELKAREPVEKPIKQHHSINEWHRRKRVYQTQLFK